MQHAGPQYGLFICGHEVWNDIRQTLQWSCIEPGEGKENQNPEKAIQQMERFKSSTWKLSSSGTGEALSDEATTQPRTCPDFWGSTYCTERKDPTLTHKWTCASYLQLLLVCSPQRLLLTTLVKQQLYRVVSFACRSYHDEWMERFDTAGRCYTHWDSCFTLLCHCLNLSWCD